MPQPDDLPVLFLPRHLSAAAAADFVDALHQLIAAKERHYPKPPLHRSCRQDIGQRDLNPAPAPAPNEPPF